MELEEELVRLLENQDTEEGKQRLKEFLESHPELTDDSELYNNIVSAISAKGEKALRVELEGYLADHLAKNEEQSPGSKKYYLMYGGIAASILIIGFLMFSKRSGSGVNPMELQMDQAPVHADSAIFEEDSVNIDKKKSEGVDTL